MLLPGEDVVPDYFALAEADVGLCLEGIGSEEVLQSGMSLLFEGVLLSNVSSCLHFWIC
jgi:hypothetical protein